MQISFLEMKKANSVIIMKPQLSTLDATHRSNDSVSDLAQDMYTVKDSTLRVSNNEDIQNEQHRIQQNESESKQDSSQIEDQNITAEGTFTNYAVEMDDSYQKSMSNEFTEENGQIVSQINKRQWLHSLFNQMLLCQDLFGPH